MALSDQQIIQALAKIREERLALCENKCNEGMIPVPVQSMGRNIISREMAMDAGMPEAEGHPLPEPEPDWDWEPCEKCLPMRELELCWHEFPHQVGRYNCLHCDEWLDAGDKNPDLTTHQHGSKLWITHALDVLGLLDEFLNDPFLTPMDLLDGKLLVPAIGAWLERGE